jgi:hypothetical protein
MKKNSCLPPSLVRRLSVYAASAGALALIDSPIQGQIIHSGIKNIELSSSADSAEVDINGDLANDFAFRFYIASNSGASGSNQIRFEMRAAMIMNLKTGTYKNSWLTVLSTLYSSTSSGTVTYIYQLPVVNGMEEGMTINSGLTNWANASSASFSGNIGAAYTQSFHGPLVDTTNTDKNGKFIGLTRFAGIRFYIGDTQHYGWIRISVDDNIEAMTIIDWAYQSAPGMGIEAGEGGGEINLSGHAVSGTGKGLNVYPNPAAGELQIIADCESDLKIIDLNGRVIYHQEKITSLLLDVSAFRPGIYIVQVQDGKSVLQQKVRFGNEED